MRKLWKNRSIISPFQPNPIVVNGEFVISSMGFNEKVIAGARNTLAHAYRRLEVSDLSSVRRENIVRNFLSSILIFINLKPILELDLNGLCINPKTLSMALAALAFCTALISHITKLSYTLCRRFSSFHQAILAAFLSFLSSILRWGFECF